MLGESLCDYVPVRNLEEVTVFLVCSHLRTRIHMNTLGSVPGLYETLTAAHYWSLTIPGYSPFQAAQI